ncbi:MAG: hypothetical protein HY613_09180 [Candidatus Rokubacteria bacterium]|nr:hypothetical protein [Candidatus Rokubacteria bacterium]
MWSSTTSRAAAYTVDRMGRWTRPLLYSPLYFCTLVFSATVGLATLVSGRRGQI